jgi:hypothetical protein
MYKGILVLNHFRGVVINTSQENGTREELLQAVNRVASDHGNAHVADAIFLDQKTGRDLACVALWTGSAVELARKLLNKAGDK